MQEGHQRFDSPSRIQTKKHNIKLFEDFKSFLVLSNLLIQIRYSSRSRFIWQNTKIQTQPLNFKITRSLPRAIPLPESEKQNPTQPITIYSLCHKPSHSTHDSWRSHNKIQRLRKKSPAKSILQRGTGKENTPCGVRTAPKRPRSDGFFASSTDRREEEDWGWLASAVGSRPLARFLYLCSNASAPEKDHIHKKSQYPDASKARR